METQAAGSVPSLQLVNSETRICMKVSLRLASLLGCLASYGKEEN